MALQWLNLDDFRPGIKGRVLPADIAASRTKVLGVAKKTGTFRCRSLPDGSLGPMPKRTYSLTPTLPVASASTEAGRVTISGFHVAGPIIGGDGSEFHIAYTGTKAVNAGFFYWQRIRHNDADQVDTLFSADPTSINVVKTSLAPAFFYSWRADPTDATVPGVPNVVMAWGEGLTGANFWKTFPSPTTPANNTPGTLAALTNMQPVLATVHQGRALVLVATIYSHGSTGLAWLDNEQLIFTEVNTIVVVNETAPQVFGMENATGYGAILSTSHSEFFMLKASGGGVFVRGDLEDPTVLRLPSLPGLGKRNQEICSSPIGVVFRADSGVWLWSGGENAEPISYETLTPDDLFPTERGGDTDFGRYFGRSYYWHDWVLMPKNWAWDWREKSWWLIDDQADVEMFHWGPQAVLDATKLYATPANVVTGEPVVYGWDLTVPADDYSWTSLPLPTGIERDVQFREIILVATGVGTVTLTYTDLAGATHVHTFTLTDANTPQVIGQNASIRCNTLQVLIEVEKAVVSGVTPVVHEIRHGFYEDAGIPTT